jgi:hypothetical protein
MEDNNNQGNPESVDDAVFGSEDKNIFERIDDDVNGAIKEDVSEATQQNPSSGSEQVTHNQEVGSNTEKDDIDYKKRYTDSSREAVELREKYKEVEPFVPVLNAMKNDSGLVNHVREYLEGGGKPSTSIQEELGIGDDFIFDAHESVTDPDSASAKVMNAHVDRMVQNRVAEMIASEKQRAQQIQAKADRQKEEQSFRDKHNMTDEQFNAFIEEAKGHVLTLEDVNYLLNRDQAQANTANSTKQDMLNQMKTVRDIPTSVSGANSQGSKSQDIGNNIFDVVKGTDSETDNLFG